MNILEMLASGLLNYSRSEPEGLLVRGMRQPAGLLGRGLNTFDRAMNMTPAQYSPDGLLGMQYRMNNPSVFDTPEDRRNLGAAYGQSLVTGPLGMAPIGWTAYHGSPHKFDKFSMGRIGTGEGAQAYGHGLYFADNPGVAQSYKDNVTALRGGNTFGGNPTSTNAEKAANNVLAHYKWNKEKALAGLDKTGPIKYGDPERQAIENEWHAKLRDAVSRWDGKNNGHLYKVDIDDARAPKEAFLNWDKPLSQQSESVQKALNNALPSEFNGLLLNPIKPSLLDEVTSAGKGRRDPTGQEVVNRLASLLGEQNVSSALNKLGIPGIRYLDAGSRASGGTYNTVLFDDSLVKILSRE